MSDASPTTPATTETFVCPVEDCRALIPDTIEDQRAHRRGHEHLDKVLDALRDGLRNLKTDFGKLRGTTRDDVRKMHDDVERIEREIGKIEVPVPVPPVTISRRGWDDEEVPDVSDAIDADEDDWAALAAPVPDPDVDPDTAPGGILEPGRTFPRTDDHDEAPTPATIPGAGLSASWSR